MTYTAVEVAVDERQSQKLRNAIEEKKPLSIKVLVTGFDKKTVLFTPAQLRKIERARLIGKNSLSVRMSRKQVQANTEHKGGFLWGLVSRLAPAILGGIASGLAARAVSSSGKSSSGQGVFIQGKGLCARVDPVKGGGLYLSPNPWVTSGEGLFIKDRNGVRDGRGLLLGENSPFKNIPLLGLLL